MADSMSLITAQIAFLESQLVLVHIPLELYSFFLQPILQLLFGEDHDGDIASIPWTNRHEFLNFSITSLGCSIICSKRMTQKYIEPVRQSIDHLFKFRNDSQEGAEIYKETYTVIQVDGQGLDADQRVIELTGPLAMAGIPIFFITTYFCDYVLVPSKARQTVTSALEQRGFVFSQEEDAFVSQLSPSLHHTHLRHEISSSCSSESLSSSPTGYRPSHSLPSTPPIEDIDELQTQTFRKLKKSNIKPLCNGNLRLVNCAGSRDSDAKQDARLKNDLLQVLLTTPRGVGSRTETEPAGDQSDELDFSTSFLSLTITASEPISILLEERLLPRLGQWLYGAKSTDDVMIPITFDLSDLAIKTTGIVGGVAGRLCQGHGLRTSYMHEEISPTTGAEQREDSEGSSIDISFLSTPRAGTVIVQASQFDRAMNILRLALEEVPED